MPRGRARARLLLLLLALVTGCGPRWRPVAVAPPRTLPPTQLVRVWHQGGAHTLHAVIVGADSLSGIPWRQAPSCATCRVSFSLGAIDSVRTGGTDLGALRPVLGTAFVITLIAFGMSRMYGSD